MIDIPIYSGDSLKTGGKIKGMLLKSNEDRYFIMEWLNSKSYDDMYEYSYEEVDPKTLKILIPNTDEWLNISEVEGAIKIADRHLHLQSI